MAGLPRINSRARDTVSRADMPTICATDSGGSSTVMRPASHPNVFVAPTLCLFLMSPSVNILTPSATHTLRLHQPIKLRFGLSRGRFSLKQPRPSISPVALRAAGFFS